MTKTMQDIADTYVRRLGHEREQVELNLVGELTQKGHPTSGEPYRGQALSEIELTDEFFESMAGDALMDYTVKMDRLIADLAEHAHIPPDALVSALAQLDCYFNHDHTNEEPHE